MKNKPTLESINLESELKSSEENDPPLFYWGKCILFDGLIIEDNEDWERDHTKLEYLEATTPLLKAINKRVIELKPNWKPEEIESRSLAEIRKEQATNDLIISKKAFKLLCQEIGADFKNDLEWEPEALDALQTALEEYLVSTFEGSNKVAIHSKRTHIIPADIQLVRMLRFERY